jgi:hypothetical protein
MERNLTTTPRELVRDESGEAIGGVAGGGGMSRRDEEGQGRVPLVWILFEDKAAIEERAVRGLMAGGVVGMQSVSHVEREHEGVGSRDGEGILLTLRGGEGHRGGGRGGCREGGDDPVHGLRKKRRGGTNKTSWANFLVIKESDHGDVSVAGEGGDWDWGDWGVVTESLQGDIAAGKIV